MVKQLDKFDENKTHYLLLSLLTFFIILGNSATDIYLPAIPTIAKYFNVPFSQVQTTITSYMLGFAACMLISGPLSDYFGRRPVVLICLSIQLISSLMCAYSHSIYELIIARFFQGLGGAFGTIISRLIIHDLFHKYNAVRALAFISTIMMLSPLLAPLIGSILVSHFYWQLIFFVLALLGSLTLMAAWLFLPETNSNIDFQALKPAVIWLNIKYLSRQNIFLGHSLLIIFSWFGCFTFISGSPKLYFSVYHLNMLGYGFVYTLQMIGYMLGAFIARSVAKYFSPKNHFKWLIFYLILISTSGSIINFSMPGNLFIFSSVVMLFFIGVGFLMPNSQAEAFRHLNRGQGIGTSLLFSVEMFGAAFASYLTTIFQQYIQHTIVLLIWISTLTILLSYIIFLKPSQYS